MQGQGAVPVMQMTNEKMIDQHHINQMMIAVIIDIGPNQRAKSANHQQNRIFMNEAPDRALR